MFRYTKAMGLTELTQLIFVTLNTSQRYATLIRTRPSNYYSDPLFGTVFELSHVL